ncbi:MAG: fumarylacetoacetate hydrolase family protein [Legionellaceae bacterium]|nr:fumarylacetoacetate hydrolase family protein [Legionellaceae bacterium]
MKLVRFGHIEQEKPGIIDVKGNIRDISAYVSDWSPESLSDVALLNTVKQLDLSTLPIVDKKTRIGACVGKPGKLIFVGYNSQAHAKEMGVTVGQHSEPILFMKPTCAVSGPFDPILFASHVKKLDWEAELAIIIGKKGKYIPIDKAKDYILGYACCNDLSERYLQFETFDTQFTKGKCFDGAATIGPYLVTRDDVLDSSNLQIKLWVNGELRQNFNTIDYIHNDETLISYVSQYFTLYPGDIISMGSAPGSASAWGHRYLKPNDQIILSITGLGEQEQVVVVE